MIEDRIRKLIEQDRKTCREKMQALVGDPSQNYFVKTRKYFEPETEQVVRLRDPAGLLCYYAQLDVALWRILHQDRFQPEDFNFHLPSHLQELYPARRQRA